jgi:molecular chaperone DnaJ
MAKDYYAILGVARDATPRQIEIAYLEYLRGMQMPQHGLLSDIQEAYRVLASPVERRAYDESHQHIPFQKKQLATSRGSAEPLIPAESAGDLIDVSLTRSFRTASPSFEEISDRLWSNFTGAPRPKAETIQSLTIEIPLTSRQALAGGTARVLVPTKAACPACSGQGSAGGFVCLPCDGSGVVLDEYPLLVDFPAGIGDYAVQVPLDGLGIHNLYLTVCFRVTRETID